MARDPTRLSYTPLELLEDGEYSELLVADGVCIHGDFQGDGSYRSPRTIQRMPAIETWQYQLRDAGQELIDVSRDLMPPQYPNVDQAVLLCREGVRDPVVCALTIVSVGEGFGAIIRDVRVPALDELFVEPMEGTALARLRESLFEAHARDEAGWGEQGGHKHLWEAARDLAFENLKIPPDVLMRIMGGGPRRRNRGRKRERLFPQVDEKLEGMSPP